MVIFLNKILVIDDHPALAEGTKFILEQNENFKADIISDASRVVDIMRSINYDVIILDLNMPEINGIDLAKAIHQTFNTKIIVYTGYEFENYFNLLVDSGVLGFVSKTASAEVLIKAVSLVMNDQAVIPSNLFRQLRRDFLKINNEIDVEITINEEEQNILIGIDQGLTNKDIAQQLHLSQRTIEVRVSNLFRKLKVNSRIHAVRKAKELGIILNESPFS